MGFWNASSSSESSRGQSSHSRHQRSTRGVSNNPFNFFASSRSFGSSSRARPRSGFVARVRRFLLEVYSYMRRHPAKVFFLIILPLITGGALTKLLSVVGIRLPRSVENLMSQFGGGRGVVERERFYSRGGARDFGGGSALPGMMGGVGQSVGGLMGLAKMFM